MEEFIKAIVATLETDKKQHFILGFFVGFVSFFDYFFIDFCFGFVSVLVVSFGVEFLQFKKWPPFRGQNRVADFNDAFATMAGGFVSILIVHLIWVLVGLYYGA